MVSTPIYPRRNGPEDILRAKKERRLTPPLRRCIGTPLMVDCRSSWAFPTSPGSQLSAAGLRSRDFFPAFLYRRLSAFRLYWLAPVSPPASWTRALSACRSFQLTLSGPPVVSSRSFFQPFDLPEPKPFPVFQSS